MKAMILETNEVREKRTTITTPPLQPLICGRGMEF